MGLPVRQSRFRSEKGGFASAEKPLQQDQQHFYKIAGAQQLVQRDQSR